MALVTLAGIPVISMYLSMPVRGIWVADVRVESEEVVSGRVDLVVDGVRFAAAVRTAGMSSGNMSARVVGGSGGLGVVDVPAQAYYRVPLRLAVQDLVSAAGETLSPTSDAGVLATELLAWTRLAGRAALALRQLLDRRGAQWRMLQDGTLWVGQDTWPEAGITLESIEDFPDRARSQVELNPSLLPGTSVGGRKISIVEHVVSNTEIHTMLTWES